MRILLIHNYYQYRGGEDSYYESLLRVLKSKKHQVISFGKDSRHISTDTLSKIIITKGLFVNNAISQEIGSVITENKPDIAHVNNVYPLITPVIYKVLKERNIPVVQTVHNYRFLCPKGTLYRANKVCELCVNKKFAYPAIMFGCYHKSYLASLVFTASNYYHRLKKAFDAIDVYIFPSHFARNYYLKHSDIPREKTVVIPYFVENKSPKITADAKKGYFLFVGRLSEEKGIIQLLNIFKLLPDIKLIVIGDGPLRRQVNEYKKYKNIIILNFLKRDEIFKFMRNAIATVIPSLFFETGPIVMIESFVSEAPVIVPNFGSFKEAVKDGKTGLFYKQNNFEELRSKILYANKHRSIMLKMGQNARTEYEAKYTSEKHYLALTNVYSKLRR